MGSTPDFYDRRRALTREGLYQLAAEEAIRPGEVAPKIRGVLDDLARRLALAADVATEIEALAERKRAAGELGAERRFSRRQLYARAIRYSCSGGEPRPSEWELLSHLRAAVHYEDSAHERVLELLIDQGWAPPVPPSATPPAAASSEEEKALRMLCLSLPDPGKAVAPMEVLPAEDAPAAIEGAAEAPRGAGDPGDAPEAAPPSRRDTPRPGRASRETADTIDLAAPPAEDLGEDLDPPSSDQVLRFESREIRIGPGGDIDIEGGGPPAKVYAAFLGVLAVAVVGSFFVGMERGKSLAPAPTTRPAPPPPPPPKVDVDGAVRKALADHEAGLRDAARKETMELWHQWEELAGLAVLADTPATRKALALLESVPEDPSRARRVLERAAGLLELALEAGREEVGDSLPEGQGAFGDDPSPPFHNLAGMHMLWVPPGKPSPEDPGLEKGFFLSAQPITHAIYAEQVGASAGPGADPKAPVAAGEDHPRRFCEALNRAEQDLLPSGFTYRPPTPGEVAHAAGAGVIPAPAGDAAGGFRVALARVPRRFPTGR